MEEIKPHYISEEDVLIINIANATCDAERDLAVREYRNYLGYDK